MGLFGGKKTYVASSCYNLAGDEANRPDYLKTMVVSNVIGGNLRASMGDAIRTGYQNGPAIKYRSYFRWAQDNYNSVIGLSASGLYGAPDIDPAVVAGYVPSGGGDVSMQMVRSNLADYEVWAEKWVLENHPDQINAEWVSDFNDDTGQITVTIPGVGTSSFAPADFQKDALYIYAAYNVVTEGETGPITSEGTITLPPGDGFPSTAGWTTDSFTSIEHTTPTPWTETHGVYSRTDFMGNDGLGRIYSIKRTMYQDQTGPDERTYMIENQEITLKAWSPLKIFIYRVGSGIAALDAQVADAAPVGGFFPPIPVRLDNKFVSSTYLPTQYEAAKKAYKRLTAGGKFDDLVAKLADNADLPDIDYVFVVPGISLNVRENACRRYLYEFFDQVRLTSAFGETEYAAWSSGVSSATGAMSAWEAWLAAQGVVGNPLNGAPEPTKGVYGSAPRNEIRVRSTVSALGYDTRIAWKSIKQETGAGLAKPTAVAGEVWLEKGAVVQETGPSYSGLAGLVASMGNTSEDLVITWQVSSTSWKRLVIRGLVHQNYVYNGKFVEIKAHEALDDEDESGFIVPIHFETWTSMSIKDTTQMATASIFLVLNSYKVKKKKWYQTGIFKIVLFVAIVVVSVVTFGAPLAGVGLLGTAAAVGTALGFSGLLATIVGAVANALAAMLLAKLISIVAIEVLGQKLGMIVAIIATVVAMNVGTGLQAGQTLQQSLTQLMNPVTLISTVLDATGRSFQMMFQADAQQAIAKTQDVLSEYNQAARSISELYEQNIGYGRGMFDPTSLTSSAQWFVEPGETFLARTLMTGSDIAEMANSLLSDFASLTLSTELPL